MPGPVLALSLIGPHGQPLFLRNFARTVGDDLKWHYAAHTSLDVFDERGESDPTRFRAHHADIHEKEALTGRAVDAYFGLLLTMGDYAVYGYQTNSRIRIVLCVELSETLVKDVDVKTVGLSARVNTKCAELSADLSRRAHGLYPHNLEPI